VPLLFGALVLGIADPGSTLAIAAVCLVGALAFGGTRPAARQPRAHVRRDLRVDEPGDGADVIVRRPSSSLRRTSAGGVQPVIRRCR